jgi:hypothetical protein
MKNAILTGLLRLFHASTAVHAARPNILIVLSDDQG